MAIEIIDGFKVIRNIDGHVLGIEMSRPRECLDYADSKGIKKIFVEFSSKGDNVKNVDFFKKHNSFTGLTITADGTDISGIQHLNLLKYLNVYENNQKIDFSAFPILEEASIDWNNKLVNLDKCQALKKLTLWKYKPVSKSLTELQKISDLESLEITQSNIESLIGIEGLRNLKNFEGNYLIKIASLKGIELLSQHLKVLVLKACKKIEGYEGTLVKMSKLEKLILSDCGYLDNINFITGMNSLKFFSFVGTNIKDGNLQPLIEKKLEYVGFDDKKHYSHKMKQINPSFSWKVG